MATRKKVISKTKVEEPKKVEKTKKVAKPIVETIKPKVAKKVVTKAKPEVTPTKPKAVVKEVIPKAKPEVKKENYGQCNACGLYLVKLLYDSKATKRRYFIACNTKGCAKYRYVLSWDPAPP